MTTPEVTGSIEQIKQIPYTFQLREDFLKQLTVSPIRYLAEEPEYDHCVRISADRKRGESSYTDIARLSGWTRSRLNYGIDRAVTELTDQHWWLQKDWQERLKQGLLKEQFVVGVNGKNFSIYNFGPQLSDEQQTQLVATTKDVAAFDPSIFTNHLWIGIHADKIEHDDPKKEGVTAGMAYVEKRFIELNQHGVTGVMSGPLHTGLNGHPKLPYALSHELGHFVARNGHMSNFPNIHDPWIKSTGWEWDREKGGFHLPNGIAPSKYALDHVAEDMPDSFTFYLYKPSDLDSVRHAYLSSIDKKEMPEITLERKVGRQITLPVARPAKIGYRLW